jgi:hypothetical protein
MKIMNGIPYVEVQSEGRYLNAPPLAARDIDEYHPIRRVKSVHVRKDDYIEAVVFTFLDDESVTYGDGEKGDESEKFELEADERICEIKFRQGTEGDDNKLCEIQFVTSKDRVSDNFSGYSSVSKSTCYSYAIPKDCRCGITGLTWDSTNAANANDGTPIRRRSTSTALVTAADIGRPIRSILSNSISEMPENLVVQDSSAKFVKSIQIKLTADTIFNGMIFRYVLLSK